MNKLSFVVNPLDSVRQILHAQQLSVAKFAERQKIATNRCDFLISDRRSHVLNLRDYRHDSMLSKRASVSKYSSASANYLWLIVDSFRDGLVLFV